MQQDADHAEVAEYLAGKYQYDSVIVLFGRETDPSRVALAKILSEAKYIVLCLDDLSILACNAEKLIWETHGKNTQHKRVDPEKSPG